MDFIVNHTYTASDITDNKYHGIYDGLIALVDGKLEHLTDWYNDIIDERLQEGMQVNDAYTDALDTIQYDIWVTYENTKHIAIFQGIAPSGAFDVFTRYTCIYNERNK